MITEHDSAWGFLGANLRSIYRDGLTCTVYEPVRAEDIDPGWLRIRAVLETVYGEAESSEVGYDGTEGELYDLREDPYQWRNLWDDPACAATKSDLIADLYDSLPPPRSPALSCEYMG